MSRAGWKSNNVQVGLPDDALTELRVRATEIGKAIGDRKLTHARVATWAVHYILSVDLKLATDLVKTGREHEQKYARQQAAPKAAPASSGADSTLPGQHGVGKFVPEAGVKRRPRRKALGQDEHAQTER